MSVEVSEAGSSMSTIDVDTVHSDERTVSLVVIFVFIIHVRFIGIFYYPETPSDPCWIRILAARAERRGAAARARRAPHQSTPRGAVTRWHPVIIATSHSA